MLLTFSDLTNQQWGNIAHPVEVHLLYWMDFSIDRGRLLNHKDWAITTLSMRFVGVHILGMRLFEKTNGILQRWRINIHIYETAASSFLTLRL